MAVTKNAYLALRDLRYKEQDRVLWIDALCINQDDTEERGQQVQQMGSIYSKAERVKETLNRAFDGQETSLEWADVWLVVVRDLRPDQREVLVEGLQTLLHRPWFKRVWIIQESTNARVVEVVCGSKSVSASILALMPHLLGVTPEPHCQPILDGMPVSVRNTSWWAEKRDLYTMLDRFRNSEATDPREKIYALLSISSNARDTELLRADYGKSLEDTIFDTVSFLLDLHELHPPIHRFFDWTLQDLLDNLNVLANKVLEIAKDCRQVAVVKMWTEKGRVDMGTKNQNSQTLLLWAAQQGHDVIANLLLDKGMPLESSGDFNITPLILAAGEGHEAMVQLLLKRGAQLEATDRFKQTPLLCAARHGHVVVTTLLLEKGAYLETKNHCDETPILCAAIAGHEPVVQLLPERPAKIRR
ncbi:ankyrin repeat-containing domain protein [Rhexocercosporidium sp. MPI-PUGE-AT-0058]|nr:ankyrin repeat-containing domain protein [Rhexocercosporidium sp. MPI-PUGE-AT-0058]